MSSTPDARTKPRRLTNLSVEGLLDLLLMLKALVMRGRAMSMVWRGESEKSNADGNERDGGDR